MAKTIKIKRSGDVFQSEREAIAFLSRTPHQPGQPVLVRYWASETEVDAILAVGTQTGFGPGTYTIVSTGGIRVVSGIVTADNELPDASMLVNGETWLYQEPVTYDLYWIYLYEDTREVTPVDPGINYRVFCLSDNSEYWLYGGSLEKANNYYSRDAIDRKIEELLEEFNGSLDDLSREINRGLTKVSDALGTDSGLSYTGTIPGASSFDDADRILGSRITQASQSLQGLSNRVSDIEKELLSDTDGLNQVTRLDEVYTWYDDEAHKTTGSIRFTELDPDAPMTAGSVHSVLVSYHWSWAGRSGWSGLVLGQEMLPFGTVGAADVADGNYDWTTVITIPETGSVSLSASFEGSDLEPVTYTLSPDPIVKNIEVTWPEDRWGKVTGTTQYQYSVIFTGTGLPGFEQGNELSVTLGDNKIFQGVQGAGPEFTTTYQGTLGLTNPPVSLTTARWGSEIVVSDLRPTYLVVLPKDSDITTETLTSSSQQWGSYVHESPTETPYITFQPAQTVVILSPLDLDDVVICSKAPGQGVILGITPDFSPQETIEFRGSLYNYRVFREIGAGTFKFIMTNATQYTE